VQSGEEALLYLANSNVETVSCPDLIFLDINMPAMNGWEFIEKYRALNNEFKRKAMIIMLTTSLFPEDATLANEIPEITAFENKPLTEEKLDAIIKKIFGDNQKKTA
jgi:CheY-like chemotaxis protein